MVLRVCRHFRLDRRVALQRRGYSSHCWPLYHGRLLVHGMPVFWQSGGHYRRRFDRKLFRHCARRRADVHHCAIGRRDWSPLASCAGLKPIAGAHPKHRLEEPAAPRLDKFDYPRKYKLTPIVRGSKSYFHESRKSSEATRSARQPDAPSALSSAGSRGRCRHAGWSSAGETAGSPPRRSRTTCIG